MAIQTLNNGDLMSTQRTKINENFTEHENKIQNLNTNTESLNTDMTEVKQVLENMDDGNIYLKKGTVKKISVGTTIPATLEEGELYFQIFN